MYIEDDLGNSSPLFYPPEAIVRSREPCTADNQIIDQCTRGVQLAL